MDKEVVILLNMGGPNDLSEVKVFLKNMFNDKYILPLKSAFLRSILAWFITAMRQKEASESYKALGGKSPIVGLSKSLCEKLNAAQNRFHFDFAMNYTPPFAKDVLARYKGAKKITFFPLYPHHSQTTVLSSLDDATAAAKMHEISGIKVIEPFYEDESFNKILINDIKKTCAENGFSPNDTHLIFSAHSLPVSIIKAGDLYEKHTNAHVSLLSKSLDFKGIHLAYQSRLGPVEWLGPNISAVLEGLKGQNVLVYPISFCIDCSESDFELDIMFREHASKVGVAKYAVVKAPNDSDGFVNYIIQKYVSVIRKTDTTFPEKIHAHGFRHSKAMHMLAAGINIVYIRDFLGHEDISTTMIYSRADNRLKNEAINKLAPKVTDETAFPDWTKDQDLLSFLNSFK